LFLCGSAQSLRSCRRLVIARRNDVAISSRVSDGSENPLRSKECSEQPDPKGHAQIKLSIQF